VTVSPEVTVYSTSGACVLRSPSDVRRVVVIFRSSVVVYVDEPFVRPNSAARRRADNNRPPRTTRDQLHVADVTRDVSADLWGVDDVR